MTVLLYVWGLSYGAVEDFTAAMGYAVSKTTGYNNVQEAGGAAREKQKRSVSQGGRRAVIGADSTYVKVKGQVTGIEMVVDSSAEQMQTELQQILKLVWPRPPDGAEQLGELFERYKDVPVPPVGERHSVWYRMRMLITRLWNRWHKFTLDQRRDDLDGTNNRCEHLIGWWIKERYRTLRGYKREPSIKNVVTLTARMGARSGHYDMTELFA